MPHIEDSDTDIYHNPDENEFNEQDLTIPTISNRGSNRKKGLMMVPDSSNTYTVANIPTNINNLNVHQHANDLIDSIDTSGSGTGTDDTDKEDYNDKVPYSTEGYKGNDGESDTSESSTKLTKKESVIGTTRDFVRREKRALEVIDGVVDEHEDIKSTDYRERKQMEDSDGGLGLRFDAWPVWICNWGLGLLPLHDNTLLPVLDPRGKSMYNYIHYVMVQRVKCICHSKHKIFIYSSLIRYSSC